MKPAPEASSSAGFVFLAIVSKIAFSCELYNILYCTFCTAVNIPLSRYCRSSPFIGVLKMIITGISSYSTTKTMIRASFLALLLLLIITLAKAQFVYPNENCAGAIELNFSNNGLLQDTFWLGDDMADNAISTIPYCDGATNVARKDVWYTFIAPDTALVLRTRFVPVASGIAHIQLFTGNCGALVSQSCHSSAPGIRFSNLVIGQRYIFRSFFPNAVGAAPSSINHTLLLKPVNDECTGATELPVISTRNNAQSKKTFSNEMATLSPVACAPLPSLWTASWEDVWYKFTATASSHAIAARAPSGTRLVVYSGLPGSFTSIGTAQFTGGDNNLVLNNLTAGNTYYIRVGSLAPIEYNLAVLADAPLNDDCATADTIRMSNSAACENNTMISNRILANSTTSPCASTNDVWYTFQATAANIRIQSGVNTGAMQFTLSSGSCGAFTCLGAASSVLTYNGLTVGQYYYLQVGGTGSVNPQSFCILPRVTNDECSGAIPLTVQPFGVRNNTLVHTQDGTESMPACGAGSQIKDLWYSFIATDTAHYVCLDGGGYFQVLNGACGSLTPVHCATGVVSTTEIERIEKVSGLVPGNPYFLRIYSSSGNTNLFSVRVSTLVPNDECAGAIELPIEQSLEFDMQQDNGITIATQSMAPCISTIYPKDIWYKFTATNNTHTILSYVKNGVSAGGLMFQVFSGSCGALTSISCYDHASSLTLAKSHTYSNFVPGNTYYIRQFGGVRNNNLRIMSGPANDDITGAVQIRPLAASLNVTSYHNFGASRRFGKICAASSVQMDHDVWFYFVASTASHTVTTSAYNTWWDEQTVASYRIEAFRGFAPDSLTLASKFVSCATNSITLNGLTAGDTIYLRVASMGINSTNIFSIKINSTLSIDEPAGAALLSKKDVFELAATTAGATQSMPASCSINDFPDDDIWFRFVAAADIKRIVAVNETTDITMQLFSGTPGNLTAIKCSNNIMLLPGNLVNGTTYYLRTYSKLNAQAATFNIGLFGEDDLYANNLGQTAANLGPNLIANSSCEDDRIYPVSNVYNGPGSAGQVRVDGWWTTTQATSDSWTADKPYNVFGNAAGSSGVSYGVKVPRSGKGMLGLLNASSGQEWSEYVTGKLNQPVKKGKTYFVSFFVSFAENGPAHVYNLGALFSNDSIHTQIGTNAINATPQIGTAGQGNYVSGPRWYNICGYFTADRDYKFITIGNFGEHDLFGGSSQATYTFLDDVLVSEVITGALPLQLLDFSGRLNAQQQSELRWVTAGESNTSRFEVEWRSSTTSTFTKIGTVAAAGNSSSTLHYDFLHTNTVAGNNYYRLKMIDIDGQFTYSSTIRLSSNAIAQSLSVFPNPASSVLNISATVERDETVLFKLIDSYGRIVFSRQSLLRKGSNAFTWDISRVTKGIYYLVSNMNNAAAVKIIKQ